MPATATATVVPPRAARAAVLAAGLTINAPPAAAQRRPAPAAPAGEHGLSATVFRSPATGVEYRAGRLAGFAGFYPTVLRADGQRAGANANFVRAGATYSLRPRGRTLYVSPSVVWSLDRDWRNGALTEAGVRWPVGRAGRGGRAAANLRLGLGVLATVGGEARVNPTVGLDVPLGGR